MSENVMTDGLEQTENEAELQEKANKEKMKKKNKNKKVLVTTTYFVAVLCLIVGLLAPVFNIASWKAISANNMMIRYIPAMFNNIFGKAVIPVSGWFLEYPVDNRFDFMSLVGVMYAVVCVLSILMFIPVFLGSKKKNTSANSALIVEVLALIVTGAYIATATYNLAKEGTISWKDYNLLIAFGGVLVMAIIQTIASKGSIGVSKVIALILSVIGVFALLDITLFLPFMASPLNKLSELLHCDKAGFVGGLTTSSGNTNFLGIDGLNLLLTIKESWKAVIAPAADGAKPDVVKIIVYLLLIAVALFTIANLVVDIIGLGTGKKFNKDRSPCRNKGSNTFALVRYCLTFVFTVAIILLIMFLMKDKGVNVGIYLYLLAAVLFIEIMNAAIRTAVANSRAKKGQLAPNAEPQGDMVIGDPSFEATAEPAYEPVYEATPAYDAAPVYDNQTPAPAYDPYAATEAPVQPEPDYQQTTFYETVPEDYSPVQPEPDYSTAPEAYPAEEVAQQPEEPAPTVYFYGGDTDAFMETLTDAQKVEFVEVFVKRTKGKVNGVEAYEIGGDNSDFFPAVFVHINRYRNTVSDDLMAKLYKQLGNL